jgi:hypothetical protein
MSVTENTKKPKQLAAGVGYGDSYDKWGDGIDMGQINFDGDTLKATREILDGKDCIVSRITDKHGKTRILQIEYPLIYADDPDIIENDKDARI